MRRLLFAVVLLSSLVSGCDMAVSTGSGPSQPSIGIQSPAMPTNLPRASIVKVVDGDTVDVSFNGQTSRVRLIGINTPETVDPRRPVECFGKEASAKAKEILAGQTVSLENDPSQQDRDQYDRLLRYIWLPDGRLFNLEMIAQGYAYEYTYDLPYKYQAIFKQAQRAAENGQIGLWSPQTCSGQK